MCSSGSPSGCSTGRKRPGGPPVRSSDVHRRVRSRGSPGRFRQSRLAEGVHGPSQATEELVPGVAERTDAVAFELVDQDVVVDAQF
jgi:hypothetical protein